MSVKLPLNKEEKQQLRKNKIKIANLHFLEVEELKNILHISIERAQLLKGLATFQQIPSIGYEMASKMVNGGYYTLSQIKEKHWVDLFTEIEEKLGYWVDPCVEDQVLCIIHHANQPNSDKQWFYFTEERKKYRKNHGYPVNRPKLAWYNVEKEGEIHE